MEEINVSVISCGQLNKFITQVFIRMDNHSNLNFFGIFRKPLGRSMKSKRISD